MKFLALFFLPGDVQYTSRNITTTCEDNARADALEIAHAIAEKTELAVYFTLELIA